MSTTNNDSQLSPFVGPETAGPFAGADVLEVAATRLRDLEGMLSRAVVVGADRCVIVVPQLSRRTADHLQSFIRHYLPSDFGLLIASKAGGSIARLPGTQEVQVAPDTRSRRKSGTASPHTATERREAFVFSDATSWLVKIILLQDADARFWSGPTGAPWSIADLAERSGVAYSAVHKTVAALRARGWLSRSGDLRIIAPRELLEAWLTTITLDPPPRTPTRALFGSLRERMGSSEGITQALRPAIGNDVPPRWALSGWSAVDALGLIHVVGNKHASITTALSLEQALDRYSLQVVDPKDATLWVTPLGNERSTFGGSVASQGDVPTVDALQAALDVSTDANRGREQAWHIFETMIPELRS